MEESKLRALPPLNSSVPSPTLFFTSWGTLWRNGDSWIDVRGKSLFLWWHQKQTKVAPVAFTIFNGCYQPKELKEGLSAVIITVWHVQKKSICDSSTDRFTRPLYFPHIECAQGLQTDITVMGSIGCQHVSNSSALFVENAVFCIWGVAVIDVCLSFKDAYHNFTIWHTRTNNIMKVWNCGTKIEPVSNL